MDSIRKVYEYAEPNLTLVGWMGFIGFPLYYFVWDFMFPQSYENLPLRLFCSALFFGIIFRNSLSSSWRKYVHVYYQITITTCLPFFFFLYVTYEWLVQCLGDVIHVGYFPAYFVGSCHKGHVCSDVRWYWSSDVFCVDSERLSSRYHNGLDACADIFVYLCVWQHVLFPKSGRAWSKSIAR